MKKTLTIEAFHGSLTEGIQTFRPASHFGDRLQALSAIGAKRFLDNVEEKKPVLYRVKISVPESGLYKVEKDWGKFGPQGALLPLRLLLEKGADQKSQLDIAKRFHYYHGEINKAKNEAEKIEIAEFFLKEEACNTYQVIQYDNKVEYDGVGYCVIDTTNLIVDSISYPTWTEVIEAFKKHEDWIDGEDSVLKFIKSNRLK